MFFGLLKTFLKKGQKETGKPFQLPGSRQHKNSYALQGFCLNLGNSQAIKIFFDTSSQ